jgi:hypothetical protein
MVNSKWTRMTVRQVTGDWGVGEKGNRGTGESEGVMSASTANSKTADSRREQKRRASSSLLPCHPSPSLFTDNFLDSF